MEKTANDQIFQALANPNRRRLLFSLVKHDPQEDLSVHSWVECSDIEQREIKIEMFHNHLPMLEDIEMIEWDEDTHAVSRGSSFEEMRPLVELIMDHQENLPEA